MIFFFASLYVLLLLMTEIQIMTIIHVSNIFITTFLNYSYWLLKVLVFLLYEFLKVSYVMLYQPLQKVLVKQHMRIANIELLYDCMLHALLGGKDTSYVPHSAHFFLAVIITLQNQQGI